MWDHPLRGRLYWSGLVTSYGFLDDSSKAFIMSLSITCSHFCSARLHSRPSRGFENRLGTWDLTTHGSEPFRWWCRPLTPRPGNGKHGETQNCFCDVCVLDLFMSPTNLRGVSSAERDESFRLSREYEPSSNYYAWKNRCSPRSRMQSRKTLVCNKWFGQSCAFFPCYRTSAL